MDKSVRVLREETAVAAARPEPRDGEAAGPVVAVHDVGRRCPSRSEERERRAAEEGEALVVVREAVDRPRARNTPARR